MNLVGEEWVEIKEDRVSSKMEQLISQNAKLLGSV
jgi:hypothetical protein